MVYRLDDRLFFANARYFKARVYEAIQGAATETQWVVFDCEAMNAIDATGVDALDQLVRTLRGRRIGFVIARLKSVVHEHFDATGLNDLIGTAYFYPTVETAVRTCLGDDASATDKRAEPGES